MPILMIYRLLFSCLIAVLLGSLPVVGFAQLSDPGRTSLQATIQAARQSLDSRRLPMFADSKIRVTESATAVENYFRAHTSAANAAKWRAYLHTEPLIEAIQSDAADETLLEHAQRTHGKLIGDIPGLELAPLVKLRDSIDHLAATIRFQEAEKSIKFIDQQLQSLDERITKVDAVPTTEDAASLAAISKMIGESNQTASVPAAMRNVFSRPNVVVSVSSALVQKAASQIVCRDRAINDCILGTRIVGTGTLQGTVTAQTLPSFGCATIQLTLAARFNSRSVGYNGPVSLNTLGSGDVMSSRTLFVNESGVSLAPTSTTASLASKITAINHPLKLVRKIASKKAAQQKPQADAIARERLRSQVGSEFDSQVSQAVASAPSDNRESALAKARTTLLRLHVPEPSRTIGSTGHSIFLEATQAAKDQFAAINSAPALRPGSYDLAIQLHESTIDNVASRILAGRTMTGDQIDRLMADVGRPRQATKLPAPKRGADLAEEGESSADESFEIDFARFRPIIFEAREQTLKVGIRGTRFKQGERELQRPLEITATYRPVRLMDGSMYLERIGDVGIEFPGGRRLTISQVALKRAIQRSFDDRFPPTLLDQRLTLPPTISLEALRGQSLRATAIDSRDGWLSVSAR